MSRIARALGSNMVLEVARGEKSVAFIGVDGGVIGLRRMPKPDFDREYFLEAAHGTRIQSTPRHFARVWLAAQHWQKADDAIAALLRELPLSLEEPRSDRNALLVDAKGAFVGCYESDADAALAGKFYNGSHVVRSAADMAQWPAAMFEKLKSQVAPALKLKGKRLHEGVFTMAKAAAKPEAPAASKVEKVTKERKPKADGPVAVVRAYVEKNQEALRSGKLTKAEARVALLAAGVVAGTIGVQLPKWLAAYKIEAVKGGTVRKDRETGKVTITQTKPKAPKAAKATKTMPPLDKGAPVDKTPADAKPKAKKGAKPPAKPAAKAKPTKKK
jgi:hypothetical protein